MPTLPEFTLLVDCCRSSFAGQARARVALPEAAFDWPRLVRLARFHRVQGIAWDALSSQSNRIPKPAAEALSNDASAIAVANLRAATCARALLDDFRSAGMPLLFIKGLTTGALAYRAPLLKMSADLDLLIAPGRVSEAAALLRAQGFAQIIPGARDDLRRWHGERKESLWRRSDGVHVDLHSRLADNLALIAGLSVNSPRQEVEVAPGVLLPTLAADELVAYLCVHGSSSAWFRLKWISDLAAILHPWRDLERVESRCRQLGAGRTGAQAILLMARVFELEDRARLERLLNRDRPTRWLVDSAERQLTKAREPHEPTAVRFGTARIHLTQLLLLPGMRFKLGEAWRQGRDAVAPAVNRWRASKISA